MAIETNPVEQIYATKEHPYVSLLPTPTFDQIAEPLRPSLPSSLSPSLPLSRSLALCSYSELPETKEDLSWAELVSLDLSTFDQPGGKEALAKQLKHAVHTVGFFYVVGYGISQEKVDKQFAIGKEVFDLSLEEKTKYAADHANGGYSTSTLCGSTSRLHS